MINTRFIGNNFNQFPCLKILPPEIQETLNRINPNFSNEVEWLEDESSSFPTLGIGLLDSLENISNVAASFLSETGTHRSQEETLSSDSEESSEENGLSDSFIMVEEKDIEIPSYKTPSLHSYIAAPFQEASFTQRLFEESQKYAFPHTTTNDYAGNLKNLRDNVQTEHFTRDDLEAAHRIMTRPMLATAREILSRQLEESDEYCTFSEQLSRDMKSIKQKVLLEDYEGSVHRAWNKFCAILNFFDPHANGNIPFAIGEKKINHHTVCLLRHAVPTIESGKVEIAGEYLAFLERCQQNHEKVLYCSLLNPSIRDESLRIHALRNLENLYPNTFHFARFPLDGPLHHLERFPSLREYKEAIDASIRGAILYEHPDDFIFSLTTQNLIKNVYEDILAWAEIEITKVYLDEKDSSEAKKALMMLFCTALKDAIIINGKINYYNNTCKDAIDRGAAHTGCDLLFNAALTDTLKESRETIRIMTSWPAFMAKTQPILKHRAGWLMAFANFIERANHQALAQSYGRVLKISETPFSFYA